MPLNKYKGYSLRNRFFFGFLFVCLLSVAASSLVPYFILRNNALTQSKIDMQEKTNAVMAFFDYALSLEKVNTEDLKRVLGNKIFEIADINKHSIIIYDLKGNYLLSDKDESLVDQKKIPMKIVNKILSDKANIITAWNTANTSKEIADITVSGSTVTVIYKDTEGDVSAIHASI